MKQKTYLVHCHSWIAGYGQMVFELQALNKKDAKIRAERALKKEYWTISDCVEKEAVASERR